MKQLFTKIMVPAIFITAFLLTGASFGAQPVNAAVDPFAESCSTAAAKKTNFCKQKDVAASEEKAGVGLLGRGGLITTITQTLIYVTGAVAVVMIVLGGFRYVLSSGDSNSTKAAKDTILYALIGLVIAIFAQIIVSFVLFRL